MSDNLQEQFVELGLDQPPRALPSRGPVENRIVVVAGFRGSGKSTLASRILRAQPRIIVIDPNQDPAYGFIKKENVVHSMDGRDGLKAFFEWVRETNQKTWHVSFVPEEASQIAEINRVCNYVFDGSNFWLAIEEIHQIAQTPAAGGLPPAVRKIINRGRHRKINSIFCGLRYAEIPRPVTAGANVHIVFQTAEPGDQEQLRNRIGTEATDAVAQLPEHKAIMFDTFSREWGIVDSRGTEIERAFNRETD